MKYEITHDNIAYQVFKKASETQRRRGRVKKLVEDRYVFYSDSLEKDPKSDPTVLSREELIQIDDYFEEIHFSPVELAYIETSRKAAKAVEERAKAQVEKERRLQKRITFYTSATALVSIIALFILGYYYKQTEQQRRIAQASYFQGQSLKAYATGNVTEAYRFAIQAVQLNRDSSNNWQALYQAVYQPDESPFFLYYANLSSELKTDAILTTTLCENDSLFAVQYVTGDILLLNIYKPTVRYAWHDSLTELPKGLHFDSKGRHLLTYDDHHLHLYDVAAKPFLKRKRQLTTTIFDANFAPNTADTIDVLGNMFMATWNFGKKNTLVYTTKKQPLADNDIIKMVWNSSHQFALLQTTTTGIQLYQRTSDSTMPCYIDYKKQYLEARFTTRDDFGVTTVLQGENYLEVDYVTAKQPRLRFKYPWTAFAKTGSYIPKTNFYDDYFSVESSDSTAFFDLYKPFARPIMLETHPNYRYLYGDKIVGFGYFAADAPQLAVFDLQSPTHDYLMARGSGHKKAVQAAFFTKNNRLITLGEDETLKRWELDLPTVATLKAVNQPEMPFSSAKFDFTGNYLLGESSCYYWTVLWHKGKEIWHKNARSVCFTPDNQSVLWLQDSGYVRKNIANMDAPEEKINLNNRCKTRWISTQTNKQNILITDEKRALHVLDATGKLQNSFTKIKIDSAISSSDGKYFIFFSGRRTWLTDKAGIQIGNIIFNDSLLTIKFSADNNYILAATHPLAPEFINHKMIFDIKTTHLVWELTSPDKLDNPNAYGFDYYSNYVVVPDKNDYCTYNFRKNQKKPLDRALFSAFAPLNNYRINIYQHLGIESRATNYGTRDYLNGKTADFNMNNVANLIFSSTGDYFALNKTGDSDQKITIFDKNANNLITLNPEGIFPYACQYQPKNAPWHTLFSKNDRYLVTYTQNNAIKLWSLSYETICEAMKARGIGE